MTIKNIAKKAEASLASNAPAILTGGGVTGVVTTAYLSAKAAVRASKMIEVEEADRVSLTNKEKLKVVWKVYIPPVLSGALTVGCIIAGNRVTSKRAAAAYSLLTVSEAAFSEYRDKIVEEIGAHKEKTVRTEIVQDRVNANPPSPGIVVGSGKVLCLETFTGRYFESDMESLRKAENQVNAMIVREDAVRLDEFYHFVGLPRTSNSSEVGWDAHKYLELEFSSVITPDGKPCLSFDYNYVRPL